MNSNKSIIAIFFQIGLIIFNIIIKNYQISLFNSISFICIIVFLLYKESKFFLMNSYYLFSCFRSFLSIVVLEFFEVNLREYGTISYYKGSIDEFILIFYIVIISLYIFYKKYKILKVDVSRNFLLLNLFLLTIMLFYVFKIRMEIGIIHRVEFASKYLFNNPLMHLIQIIIFFIPFYIGLSINKERKISLLLLLELFLYAYFIGEKFGMFYRIICFFTIGFAINNSNEFCKKIWLKLVFVFTIIIGICISVFSGMYKVNYSKGTQYFLERIAQDNESWWVLYNSGQESNLVNEIKSFKYKGTQDLYKIGYSNASKFGSHYLRKKMIGDEITSGEYQRKKRIATGGFTQLYLNSRIYYGMIVFYTFTSILILKKITNYLSFKGVASSIMNMLIASFLLRFYLTLKTGLFQINNDFFNIKTLELIIIIGVFICLKKILIGIQKKI